MPAIALLGSAIAWSGAAGAGEAEPDDVRVVGHVLEPASVTPTDAQKLARGVLMGAFAKPQAVATTP